MSDKGESRPAFEVAGAGWEKTKDCGRAYKPHTYSSTALGKTQAIFDLLPQGEENAVSSAELVRLVGCGTVRELQSRIADERANGSLILSTCRRRGGYFRPSSGEQGKQEINRYVATLRARALNTLKVLRAAKVALGQVDG